MRVAPQNSEISIATMREGLKHLSYPPLEVDRRVLIIDQAETLNRFAANALLKTLEEPQQCVIIALISASPRTLLPTLRSRLKIIRFAPLPEGERAKLEQCSRLKLALLDQLPREAALPTALEVPRDRLLKLLRQQFAQGNETPGARALARWQLGGLLHGDEEAEQVHWLILITLLRDLYYLGHRLDDREITNQEILAELKEIAAASSLARIEQLFYKARVSYRNMIERYANRRITIEDFLCTVEESEWAPR
jgi:hypothetical protein